MGMSNDSTSLLIPGKHSKRPKAADSGKRGQAARDWRKVERAMNTAAMSAEKSLAMVMIIAALPADLDTYDQQQVDERLAMVRTMVRDLLLPLAEETPAWVDDADTDLRWRSGKRMPEPGAPGGKGTELARRAGQGTRVRVYTGQGTRVRQEPETGLDTCHGYAVHPSCLASGLASTRAIGLLARVYAKATGAPERNDGSRAILWRTIRNATKSSSLSRLAVSSLEKQGQCFWVPARVTTQARDARAQARDASATKADALARLRRSKAMAMRRGPAKRRSRVG